MSIRSDSKHFRIGHPNTAKPRHTSLTSDPLCLFCNLSSTTINCFFNFIFFNSNTTSNDIAQFLYPNYSHNNYLKLYYQNVHCLRTELIDLQCSAPMVRSHDIIIQTETWLSPDISDTEHGLDDFTTIYMLVRNINNSFHSRGGGVLIAVKSSITSSHINLTNSSVEHIFVLLSIDHSSFLIGLAYLPPSSSSLVIESHLSTIE